MLRKRGKSVEPTRELRLEGFLLRERSLLEELQKKIDDNHLKLDEVLKAMKKEELSAPISAIADIHPLEGIVLYLKHLGIGFTEISSMLNRSYATIYTSYRNAVKRKITKKPLTKEEKKILKKINAETKDDIKIPISAISNRPVSILEGVVIYLKEKFNLRYHDIGILLNRDERTIWTVYQRAIKRHGKKA